MAREMDSIWTATYNMGPQLKGELPLDRYEGVVEELP